MPCLDSKHRTTPAYDPLTQSPPLPPMEEPLPALVPRRHSVSRSSPISRLPYELLTEIFLSCLPPHQFIIPSQVQAPLLLTQVCARWRSIALSTPHLWASLHINYHDPTKDVPSTVLWLSRSGDLPLSLSLSVDFNEQRHQSILNALTTHSTRWRHVRLDFRHLLCPPMYTLARAAGRTPALHTFEFRAADISPTNVSPITHLLAHAPALRDLTWVDDLADTDTLLGLPLARLTRLSLAIDRGSLDYLEVLDQCPNLEHIQLTRPAAPPTAAPARPPLPLCLAKLTSLTISHDIAPLLAHLVLPALQHVRIHPERTTPASPMQSAPWDPAPVLDLLSRSVAQLASLSVHAPMQEDALIQLLRHPSTTPLSQLSIAGIALGDALLSQLTPPDADADSEEDQTDPFLCPHLEQLTLDTRMACSPGVLLHMVAARLGDASSAPSRTPLRILRVLDGPRDVRTLWELKDRGELSAALQVLEVIPRREEKPRRRNLFYRRKLCPSR